MRYLLAGLSTRGLAESAAKAGKDFVCVDFFGDLDLEKICECVCLRREYDASLDFVDPSLFLEGADRFTFERIVYASPLENYPKVISKFAETCEITGNDAETVRKVRNWRILSRFCKENNILFPETFDGLHFVAKPKKSGGGIGIQRLSTYLVQEYVKGEHFSASFLGDGSHAQLVSVNEQLIGRKEVGARKFWYCGNITPVERNKEDVEDVCRKLVEEFELKGSCGIDFVINKGLYLMEVNPRPQATLEIVERAFNVNMFLLHEKSCNRALEPLGHPRKTWGKAILYAVKDVVMPDTYKWLDSDWIKDIPHPSERIAKSEPICTVIADGSSRDDCFEHLMTRAESVRAEINS